MDRLDQRVRRRRQKPVHLMRPRHRLGLRAVITAEPRPDASEREQRTNHTTSFFFVSGFSSGAYSAKLFAGTRHRFSGLSHMRQCGEVVVRIFVTGGHGDFGGGGMPQRIRVISVPLSVLRITGAG
jgi:hypothetical protein